MASLALSSENSSALLSSSLRPSVSTLSSSAVSIILCSSSTAASSPSGCSSPRMGRVSSLARRPSVQLKGVTMMVSTRTGFARLKVRLLAFFPAIILGRASPNRTISTSAPTA